MFNGVPAGQASQAPVDLNVADPSMQTLLRYYMQSDQDYLTQ